MILVLWRSVVSDFLTDSSPPELLINLYVNVSPHLSTMELLHCEKHSPKKSVVSRLTSLLMPTGYCHVLYMDTYTVVNSDIEVQWQECDPCCAGPGKDGC